MQDEVNEKTIALYIKTGKLTAQTLQKAMKAILSKGKKQLAKPPQGKQSLKQLMKQNAGVSNIEITKDNIKAFESTAKKYGIDFALKKDSTETPPRYLYPEDRSRMEEIKQADPAAVVVNGYYSGYLGEDRNLDELTAGVRRHYENGYSNIWEFIEAHDDRLPPELIEEARAAAHAAGLPFSEKAYRGRRRTRPLSI